MSKNKPNSKLPLHKFIATGGKPEDYEGSVESAEEEKGEKEK